jgi:hypothetical protein
MEQQPDIGPWSLLSNPSIPLLPVVVFHTVEVSEA